MADSLYHQPIETSIKFEPKPEESDFDCFNGNRDSQRNDASKVAVDDESFDVSVSSEEIHSNRVFSLRKNRHDISTKENYRNTFLSNCDGFSNHKNDSDVFRSNRSVSSTERDVFSTKRENGFDRELVENVERVENVVGERARLVCSSASDDSSDKNDGPISDDSNASKAVEAENHEVTVGDSSREEKSRAIPNSCVDIQSSSSTPRHDTSSLDVTAPKSGANLSKYNDLSGSDTSSDNGSSTKSETNHSVTNNSLENFPFLNFRTGFPISLPTWLWMKK